MHRWALAGGLALLLFGAACADGGDVASDGPARASAGQPITVGLLRPRTGPVENIGIPVCIGVDDDAMSGRRSFWETKRYECEKRWLW